MDTTKTVTHVSLCAGYGGIDLGLKRVIPALRTVAFSEIEAFACANLVSKMEAGHLDPAPIWTNLKTFPWSEFRGCVDILSGGYPCQPFSAAGKRLGADDPRHLWPFIADGIRLMRPRLCFFENVEGHISLGLRAVVEELAGIGYETTWGIFSASEVGAPHQRKRVFILAHDQRERVEELARQITTSAEYPPLGTAVLLAEPSGERSAAGIPRSESGHEGHAGIADHGCHQDCWPSRPGEPQHEWEPPRVVGAMAHARSPRAYAQSKEVRSRDNSAGEPGAVGNTTFRQDDGREPGDMAVEEGCGQCGDDAAGRTGEVCMGSPMQPGLDGPTGQGLHGAGRTSLQPPSGRESWTIGQTESPLGGDADGPAGGMDYAQLCVTSDNRTDELRLLGNGVVPATAAKAFITLLEQLTHRQSIHQ